MKNIPWSYAYILMSSDPKFSVIAPRKIEKDETGRLHPFTKTNQTN